MDHYREAMSIHDWQILQPAILEALVHLTLGGPMPAYHGGHLHVAVRYFDVAALRPGLPDDVAALVESNTEDSVKLTLVNTSQSATRSTVVQAGAFGEHQIIDAQVNGGVTTQVNDPHIQIDLAPMASASIVLHVKRFANEPTYEWPFGQREEQVSTPETITGRTLE